MTDFDTQTAPPRRRQQPEYARPWLITFTSVFLAVLLANLLSYLIAYQVARAYLDYKSREFIHEMNRNSGEFEKHLKEIEKRMKEATPKR